ncbi:MAG: FAD-binding oxidoreductase [Cytophagales bacterium]|nr:FAD-binding oxidoreductase [Cytophagales bacterium]
MYVKARIIFPITFILHGLLWHLSIQLFDGEISIKSIIGEGLSSWVVTVFAFNFLMATRAKWIERIFGGLDKMYVVHRKGAIIGLVVLLLHFIIVPKAEEMYPGKPMAFFAFLLILIGVIISVAPPMKKKIRYASWLKIHKTMGPIYTLGVLHSFFVPTMISQMPVIRTYTYLFAFVGIGAWIYRAFLYGLFNKKYDYEVDSANKLTKDTLEVKLKPTNGRMRFKPGQFAFLKFTSIENKEIHPFTISSHPSSEALRFSIKASGDYTQEIQEQVMTGTKVKLEGPFGMFDFTSAKYKDQLWLAGGIGITPFLSFLREVDNSYNIKLAWSVKKMDEAPYHEEISRISLQKENMLYLLQETEKDGFLDPVKFAGNWGKDISVFICGPLALRTSFIKQLRPKGISLKNIHFEEFSFR